MAPPGMGVKKNASDGCKSMCTIPASLSLQFQNPNSSNNVINIFLIVI